MKLEFRHELEALINKHSMENVSGTPDFILCQYLMACLAAYEQAVVAREKWHGRGLSASEALFGFAGWLTSREEPVTFSRAHNAAIAAELVDEFCKVNNLTEPRDGWADNLTQPQQPAAIEGEK